MQVEVRIRPTIGLIPPQNLQIFLQSLLLFLSILYLLLYLNQIILHITGSGLHLHYINATGVPLALVPASATTR